MNKLKCMCPGVLIIADSNLRLSPGQVFEVSSLTQQMETALKLGLLSKVNHDQVNEDEIKKHEVVQNDIADLGKLSAADAIAQVNAESDPVKLRSYMETEKRRSVLDVLRNRVTEVNA